MTWKEGILRSEMRGGIVERTGFLPPNLDSVVNSMIFNDPENLFELDQISLTTASDSDSLSSMSSSRFNEIIDNISSINSNDSLFDDDGVEIIQNRPNQ